MDLVTPGIGLLFWTVLTFGILLLLLKKFAWKPILKAVKDRESNISEALEAAEKAKREMTQLQASNDKLLKEARVERDAMLKEARDDKKKLIEEAKVEAKAAADKLIAAAKQNIEGEKNAALSEIKDHVAKLSLEIAEKVLQGKLDTEEKQKELATQLAADISLN